MIKNYKVGDIIYCVDPKCSGYGLIVSIIDKITNKRYHNKNIVYS
mgnify:FL=1